MSELTIQDKYRHHIERLAGAYVTTIYGTDEAAKIAGRFALAFRTAAAKDPKIYQCEPESVARTVATCALLDLVPGGIYPTCYALPRWNKNVKAYELNFQISYRGLQELAARHGWLIEAYEVHKDADIKISLNPRISIEYNIDPDQSVSKWDDLRGFVVVASRGDETRTAWVNRGTIAKRRDASESYRKNFGPWIEWPVGMARKTAIIYVISRGMFLNSHTLDVVERAERADFAVDTDLQIEDLTIDADPADPEEKNEAGNAGIEGLAARFSSP